jgi:serine protease Do/serine protease DegQ
MRENKLRTASAELGRAEDQVLAGGDMHPGLTGASFAPAGAGADGGIEVTEVVENSPAAQRGLRQGDVIIAVNRTPVRTLSDLANIVSQSRILFLLVQRGDRSLMLQIR